MFLRKANSDGLSRQRVHQRLLRFMKPRLRKLFTKLCSFRMSLRDASEVRSCKLCACFIVDYEELTLTHKTVLQRLELDEHIVRPVESK